MGTDGSLSDRFGSFESLFVNAPMLRTSDFHRPFTMATNVIDYTIGGVVLHGFRRLALDNGELNSLELNYTTTKK